MAIQLRRFPWRLGVLSLVALLALHAASATATAAPKRITGKLSKAGYSVIAVAASGEGEAVQATPRFKLRPPAKRVSLHLQTPDGVYAGPIVVGVKSGRKEKGKKRLDLRKKKASPTAPGAARGQACRPAPAWPSSASLST